MSESITLRFTLPVPASKVYDAWLDSAQHTAMTGARATASREVGDEFTAWDGYIRGKNLLLIENQKIVQSWRSSEFPDEAPDSVLSIRLTERHGITEVELEHADIPPGQSVQYQSGWIEFYVNPMQKYFATQAVRPAAAAKKSAAAANLQQRKKSRMEKNTRTKSVGAKKKLAKPKSKTSKVSPRRKK